nr:ORF 1 [Nicotiana sp.]
MNKRMKSRNNSTNSSNQEMEERKSYGFTKTLWLKSKKDISK